jgi:cytochrome c oxidase subunit 2
MINWSTPLFPEQASSFAADVDSLYFFMIGVSMFFTILIGALIITFVLKFRRRSDGERPKEIHGHTGLEVFWTVIPLILVMIMFFWGAAIFYKQFRPPADAMEILVTGKQWMWKMQHPTGRWEINDLHVPLGRPVRLTMTSEDVIHSMYIPAFRAKADVVPGKYTSVWFKPTKPGRFHLFCTEYCGAEHSLMKGWIYILPEDEYDRWAAGESGEMVEMSPVEAGERLFADLGCAVCHNPASGALGPYLAGRYGTEIHLNDGRLIVADDDYLRESILYPMAKVVEGYQPIMPTYQGQVTELQLMQIIAYLKSLNGSQTASITP